jgi:DNA repair photolyase
LVAPFIRGLRVHEVAGILKASAGAGATVAGYVPVRLPLANKVMFEDWLGQHYPDRKEKVLNRIRSLRGGKLNDSNFGSRMRGEGVWAGQIATMFELAKRKAGLDGPGPEMSVGAFRRPVGPGGQLGLFE